MDNQEQIHPENWQTLHSDLRDVLQNEIRLTRELLSNMHQEEISLMLQDTGTMNQILQQRSEMLEGLSSLRLQRLQTTERIEKIVGHKDPSLEKILPPYEEITSEILSLSDQLMALTERINRQQTHNQHIAEHGDHHGYPPLQVAPESRPKRKAAVATYHLKK